MSTHGRAPRGLQANIDGRGGSYAADTNRHRHVLGRAGGEFHGAFLAAKLCLVPAGAISLARSPRFLETPAVLDPDPAYSEADKGTGGGGGSEPARGC